MVGVMSRRHPAQPTTPRARSSGNTNDLTFGFHPEVQSLYSCCTNQDPSTGQRPDRRSGGASDLVLYLVAGAGFEPATFGL